MRVWFERGFRKKSITYELEKMFPPHSFLGFSGNITSINSETDDLKLLTKFYKKYPEVKYFPSPRVLNFGYGGQVEITQPAIQFIKK